MKLKEIIKFDELDKGKKIVLFGFIPFFLLLISVSLVLLLSGNKNDDKELEENPYKNINLETISADEDETILTRSKTEAYRNRKIAENLPALDTTIDIESPFELMRQKQEKEKLEQELEEQRRKDIEDRYNNILTSSTEDTEQKATYTQKPKATTTAKKSSSTSTKVQSNKKVTYKNDESNIKVEPQFYSRYGGYENTNESNNNAEVYASAFLERDTKIKDGSEPVFILEEDCVINGIEYKKMSYLFTKAELKNGRLYINARKILDTKNKEHHVNLNGYNDNYFEGVAYDDSFSEAMNEGKEEIVDDLVDDIPYQKSARALGRSIQKLKKKEDYIILEQGFTMKFK